MGFIGGPAILTEDGAGLKSGPTGAEEPADAWEKSKNSGRLGRSGSSGE